MSLLGYHVPMLRAIPDELGLASVIAIARRPGITDVYRITVHYYDRRACDSVATLIRTMMGGAVLEIVYRRALDQKPLTYKLDDRRYRAFVTAIKMAGYDKLIDQTGLPAHDATDVWMIDRSAGTFNKSIVVAPEIVQSVPHKTLIDAVRSHLPEALRMVK